MRLALCCCCLLAWPALVAGQAGAARAVIAEHTHTRDVRAIALDGERVWVATSGGLVLYGRDGVQLRKLGARDGLPGSSVHDVTVLADGSVLVATERGAARVVPAAEPSALRAEALPGPTGEDRGPQRFDPARVALAPGSAAPAALLYMQSGVRDLRGRQLANATAPHGLWSAAARTTRGLALGGLDGRLTVPARAGGAVELSLSHPVLALAALDRDVIVASGETLERWNGSALTPWTYAGAAVAASALGRGRDGSLLVGTASGLVLEARGDELQPIAQAGTRVTAVVADRDIVWLGLGGRGLARIARGTSAMQLLTPEGEICSNHVTSFTRHRGLLVVGSFDGGACYLRDGRWHALATDSRYVHGVASDGEQLWIAHSNGIARYGRDWSPEAIGAGDPSALVEAAGRAATAALFTADRQLLFASASGVLEVTRDAHGGLRASSLGHERGVPPEITALASSADRVYVASETAGVVELRARRVQRRLRDPDALPEAWVTALAATADALWVGTCQRGVARVTEQDARMLDRRTGLPGDRVIALAAVEHGVVIGTLGGLALAALDGSSVQRWALPVPDRRISGLFGDGRTLWVGTEFGLAEVELGSDPTAARVAAR